MPQAATRAACLEMVLTSAVGVFFSGFELALGSVEFCGPECTLLGSLGGLFWNSGSCFFDDEMTPPGASMPNRGLRGLRGVSALTLQGHECPSQIFPASEVV